jgi:hypothetical protein
MQMDKLTKLSIAGGIFLIGASLFYYLVIFIPKKEQMKADQLESQRELQREQFESQRELLETCIEDAQRNYLAYWNQICNYRGKKEKCALYDHDLERVDNLLKESKNECFRKYQAGAVRGADQEQKPHNAIEQYRNTFEQFGSDKQSQQNSANNQTAQVIAYGQLKQERDDYISKLSQAESLVTDAQYFQSNCTNRYYAEKYGGTQGCVDHWSKEISDTNEIVNNYQYLLDQASNKLKEAKRSCSLCY